MGEEGKGHIGDFDVDGEEDLDEGGIDSLEVVERFGKGIGKEVGRAVVGLVL